MSVYVLDRSGQPLMPCSEKRARKLLASHRARMYRLQPFVIRFVDRGQSDCVLQPLCPKLDSGSKTTGLAAVRDTQKTEASTGEIVQGAAVVNLMELLHCERQIFEALTARRQMRRRRRSQLRYRAPKFLNHGNKTKGRLAPSLKHRVNTTLAWVRSIQCTGRGSYRRTRLDKYGFPRGYLMRSKRVHGFGTGAMVRAEVPKGGKVGVYRGRVAVRATGSFNIQMRRSGASVVIQGISHEHCRMMQCVDGYGYFLERATDKGREQARHKASDAAHPVLCLPGMNAGVSRAI